MEHDHLGEKWNFQRIPGGNMLPLPESPLYITMYAGSLL